MKLRLGYLLLAFGLLALIILTVVRLGRERLFYELQLREQADSIESGLLHRNGKIIFSQQPKKGELPKDFVLRWNRTGKVLLSPFYPQPGVQLEWGGLPRRQTKKQSRRAKKTF